jgi:hypothetical protein
VIDPDRRCHHAHVIISTAGDSYRLTHRTSPERSNDDPITFGGHQRGPAITAPEHIDVNIDVNIDPLASIRSREKRDRRARHRSFGPRSIEERSELRRKSQQPNRGDLDVGSASS